MLLNDSLQKTPTFHESSTARPHQGLGLLRPPLPRAPRAHAARLAELLTAGQETPVRESTVQRWEYGRRTPPPYLKLALRDIARQIPSGETPS
jgi:hypothetical protein